MKGLGERLDLLKISVVAFACLASFSVGRHWSQSSANLVFYRPSPSPAAGGGGPSVAVSPNANLTVDISALIFSDSQLSPPVELPSPPPPSPPPAMETFGVVDEGGAMRDDFEVGEFDPDLVEKWGDEGTNETREGEGEEGRARVRIKRFRMCPASMREYIPCLDNEEEIRKLRSTERGERFERRCPGERKGLDCLVPAPRDYKTPIPWPRSRDEVLVLLNLFIELSLLPCLFSSCLHFC